MKRYTIIWDFDGTLFPREPYDSEQSLLIHRLIQSKDNISLLKRVLVRAIIYADMKERLRKTFKKLYLWFLKGTKTEALDLVTGLLAKKISEADRQTLLRLKEDGHNMMVISCGTVDLSERILKIAGLDNCFSIIEGNRFQIDNDQITGMDSHIPNPEDKLKLITSQGICPEEAIAIGDGYTDFPLLDWAGVPVLIDRTGEKKDRYAKKNYHYISSIPEIAEMIKKDFV